MAPENKIVEIEPKDLKDNDLLLDIRTNQEHSHLCLTRPHFHVPLEDIQLPQFIKDYQLNDDKTLYVICRSGGRSKYFINKLNEAGFTNAVNVKGGILNAQEQGLSVTKHSSFEWNSKSQTNFFVGALLFLSTLLFLYVSTAFLLIPLCIGFLLILQSITGKNFMEGFVKTLPWNKS